MIKSIINEKNEAKADVVLMSAPYEKTASSHKGTVKGPKAIIKCLDSQIEFFDRKFKVEVPEFVKTAHLSLPLQKLSPARAYEKLRDNSSKLVSEGKFVFVLGGEHSVSVGNIEALNQKYDPKTVTILQIDAHCDLRDDDGDYSKTPTKFAHSAVMR
jgi:agmatinase